MSKNLEKIDEYYKNIHSDFNTQFTSIKEDLTSNDRNLKATAESNMSNDESDIQIIK